MTSPFDQGAIECAAVILKVAGRYSGDELDAALKAARQARNIASKKSGPGPTRAGLSSKRLTLLVRLHTIGPESGATRRGFQIVVFRTGQSAVVPRLWRPLCVDEAEGARFGAEARCEARPFDQRAGLTADPTSPTPAGYPRQRGQGREVFRPNRILRKDGASIRHFALPCPRDSLVRRAR
jgi:hypothetical protein